MKKLTESINKYLMPIALKLKQIKELNAISDGVLATFPLLMVGSFAVLIMCFPQENVLAWINSTPIAHICSIINTFTTGVLGLVASMTIAYSMAQQLGTDVFMNTALSAVSFLILQGVKDGAIATTYLGHRGLFVAMILGVIIPRIYKWFIDKKIYIRMPDSVPPMISKTFAGIIPVTFILILMAVIESAFCNTESGNLIALFYNVIQKPFTKVGASLPGMWGYILAGALVNFVGVHSTALTNLWLPVLTSAAAENLAAFEAGQPIPNIVSEPFRCFLLIGGFGCLIGLQVCMLLFGKSERIKTISRVSFVPALFNINEPVLFGFPIMMNPVMFIPFILAPCVNVTIAYFAAAAHIVPALNGANVSWAMPTVIKVLLSGGGIPTVILVLVLVAIDTAIYYPFFRIMDNKYLEEEGKKQ